MNSRIIEYKKRRRKIKPKTTLVAETRKTIKSLIITLSLMIVALAIVLLATMSLSSQRGYSLNQEKMKNEHLKTVNNNLKAKITTSTAFTEIKNSNKLDDMKTIEEKDYLTKEDNEIN